MKKCTDKVHTWPGSQWEVDEPAHGEPCECGKDTWYASPAGRARLS